jgi:hypothetical protein
MSPRLKVNETNLKIVSKAKKKMATGRNKAGREIRNHISRSERAVMSD